MTRQKLAIRIVIAGFTVITGVLGIAALWLDSAQGLEWARQKLVRAGNGTIEVENARGSLLGGAIDTTYAYTPKIIARFLADCDPVFVQLRTHLDRGDLAAQLKGRVIQPGFRRLT